MGGVIDWLTGSNSSTTQESNFNKKTAASAETAVTNTQNISGTQNTNTTNNSTSTSNTAGTSSTNQTNTSNSSNRKTNNSETTTNTNARTDTQQNTTSTAGTQQDTAQQTSLLNAAVMNFLQARLLGITGNNIYSAATQGDVNSLRQLATALQSSGLQTASTINANTAAAIDAAKATYDTTTAPAIALAIQNLGSSDSSAALKIQQAGASDLAIKLAAIGAQGAVEAQTAQNTQGNAVADILSKLATSQGTVDAGQVLQTDMIVNLANVLKGAAVNTTGSTTQNTTSRSGTTTAQQTQESTATRQLQSIIESLQTVASGTSTTNTSQSSRTDTIENILSNIATTQNTTGTTNTTNKAVGMEAGISTATGATEQTQSPLSILGLFF